MKQLVLGDFHIHSTFSDGKLTIPEIVDLYGSLGFGAIAITDHLCESHSMIGKAARYIGHTLTPASFPLYIEILKSEADRAMKQYQMVVIPGVEISKNSISNHRSAHILALGITQWISADKDALEIVREIKSLGGLSVAAHPVWTRKREKQSYHLWDRREELKSEIDAWEVASGPYFFDEVLHSGLPMIASSDLHHRNQITSWKSVLHCKRTQADVFMAIRNQELSFQFYQEVNNDYPRSTNAPHLVRSPNSDTLRNSPHNQGDELPTPAP